MYNCFRCQVLDITINKVSFIAGSTEGSDSADPEPIYGRGMWFDGDQYSHFENLNVGQDFTLSIWTHANDFRALFSIGGAEKGTIFEIREGIRGNNHSVVEIYLQTFYGNEHVLQSGYMEQLSENTGFELNGQWVHLMVYLKSYFNNYDLINDQYVFATELQLSYNENVKAETLSIQNDIWCEDSTENQHYVGRNYDGSKYYVGFIGDIIFANHDAVVDNVSFTSAGSGCPTCVECPEAITYIACLMNDGSDCQQDPFCPVDCRKGQYVDENNNCQNCVNGCDSCNNGVTCNTCQDHLCVSCST